MIAGTLEIQLLANLAQLKKDMDRATGIVDQSMRQIARATDMAKAALGGFAAAISVRELGQLVGKGLDYASSLGEVAQQLGVTTKDLQEYRYMATQVGIEQGDMDRGLAKLTQNLGKAATGGKAQAAVFSDLGIKIRDAGGHIKTAGDVLPVLADHLAAIKDPAIRAAIETELFGKAGQKLDTLLAGGSAQVYELAAAVREMGGVLSDEQIQHADDAADKLAAVKTILEANIAGVVADNADAILKLGNALGTVVGEIAKLRPDQWKMILGGATAGAVAGFLSPVPGGLIGGALLGGGAVAASGMQYNSSHRAPSLGGRVAGASYDPVTGKWTMPGAAKVGGYNAGAYEADETARRKEERAADAAAKKALEERNRLLKIQKDYENDTTGLERQVALIIAGTSSAEARMRAEAMEKGISQEAIEKRVAAEEALNMVLANRSDFEKHMADSQPLVDFNHVLTENVAQTNAASAAYERYIGLVGDIDLDGAFGRGGKALASMVNGLDQLIDRQDAYVLALQKEAMTDEERVALQRQHQRLSINSYATMAGAAKQFFKENSTGYKALYTAEKAFRAIELALALKTAATKIGLIGATTTAKISSDTVMAASDTTRAGIEQGNSLASTAVKAVEAVVNAIRSLPFPLNIAAGAATAGVIASLGVAVGGSFGGGGSKPSYNTGTGTVLGDNEAQSESITKSLEHLRDIDMLTMKYSSQMAVSLKSIEQNIGGLASLIVRTGNVQASGAGIQTGTTGGLSTLGSMGLGPVGALAGNLISKVPIIGGLLNGVAKALFGTKTSIIGQGIMAGPQSLADILGNGFDAQYFTDVQKKKKTFGITTSTKYSTQSTAADAELENQFSMVLRGFYDALAAAAVPLGTTLDGIQGQLNSFVVDLGRINLQGKTGQEIQDELIAVFGAAGDQMAQAAFPGLEGFQKVGEGYLETVIRVSSSVEAMSNAFDMLGRAANLGVTSTMALVDAFGDAATMQSVVGDYFSAFYTDAERAAAQTAQLSRAMEGLGLSLPGSTAAFRALVDAQDLTSDAGRQAYVTLMQLAPMFAEVFGTAQDSIEALVGPSKSAADITKERLGLEGQLLQLQGDTAELRRRELAELDVSNRGLQEQIWALQDSQEAQEKATQAAEQLKSAWTSIADSLLDEVKRIRGVMGASGGSYASLLAQFNAATGAARAGDQDAAKSLTGLSQSLLTAAADMATNQADLARIQGTVAASLEQTAGMVGGGTSAGISSLLGTAGTASQPAWWESFISGQMAGAQTAANDSATVAEMRRLNGRIDQLIEDQRAGHAAIAGNGGKIVKKLDRIAPDDAMIVRAPDDEPLSTKEAA